MAPWAVWEWAGAQTSCWANRHTGGDGESEERKTVFLFHVCAGCLLIAAFCSTVPTKKKVALS